MPAAVPDVSPAQSAPADARPATVTPIRPELEARPLARFDLAAVVRDGVPPPELMCGDLLYAGGMHTLTGPPDCGKTTFAYAWAKTLLDEGRPVAVFDEEIGHELAAEKLIAMGVEPAAVDRIWYYPFPGRSWTPGDVAELARVVMAARPALAIFDSAAAFLARAGLDENAAADVTRFWSDVLTPCARRAGVAVAVIDHETKNGGPSRYGRGSGAKLAATDVAYKLDAVKPFTREQDGVLKLTVSKDRRGWLHRAHRVHVTRNPLAFTLTEDHGADAEVDDMPPARRKLLDALDDQPRPAKDIVDRVNARHGHGLGRQTVSAELNALALDGLADRLEQGNGRSVLWSRAAQGGDRA